MHTSDVTFHMDDDGRMQIHQRKNEPWKVSLIDTGDGSMTGGRLSRIRPYLNDETFCFTYGDGLADVDINLLVRHHEQMGKLVTLTAVQPPGRYGALHLEAGSVLKFQEKPDGDNAWINGGFFVLEPDVLDWISDDSTSWESDVLPKLLPLGSSLLFAIKDFGNLWILCETKRGLRIFGTPGLPRGSFGDA